MPEEPLNLSTKTKKTFAVIIIGLWLSFTCYNWFFSENSVVLNISLLIAETVFWGLCLLKVTFEEKIWPYRKWLFVTVIVSLICTIKLPHILH